MTIILASILLAVATNIDNFTVGIIYGIRKTKITLQSNFLIACLSGLTSLIAMILGESVSKTITPTLASDVGSLVLIMIGVVTVGSILFKKTEERELEKDFEPNNYSAMNIKQATFLGLALTVTNWGTGIGGGMVQLDVMITSFGSFISSLLTIGMGNFLGASLASIFANQKLEIVAGCCLIVLGVYEYYL